MVASTENDAPVARDLVQNLQDGHLARNIRMRTGQEVEDRSVEASVDSLQGRSPRGITSFGLCNQFQNELEHFVGILLEDALPQFVHYSTGHVENVGWNVLHASFRGDWERCLISDQHIGCQKMIHENAQKFGLESVGKIFFKLCIYRRKFLIILLSTVLLFLI